MRAPKKPKARVLLQEAGLRVFRKTLKSFGPPGQLPVKRKK
jgi:hypothetical protein